MKKRIFQNDEGISPVLGFILILAIGVTLLSTVQLSFVPVWNTQEELDHIKLMQDDLKVLKSNIESGIQSGTTLSSPLTMGFKYSPKMFVYNPRDEAYASLDISNNTWVELRYNEVFPEGMTDETSIKNIRTGMITYALHGARNYNSFIYENGLIRRSGSGYTTNSQTVLANNTIFLPSLKALDYGTISGAEKRTVNIYPTSQQKNSVIGQNVWLILHTDPDYVDWWETNLEKEGATVRKKDATNGIVIANISSSLVIKMGEAYISTSQKTSPPHSPATRIVKVSGTGTSLPVGGTTSITVEVQDEYNNPVPNVPVSFSRNATSTGHPSNSYSNATISPGSAISGSDGRASVTLTANDAGFYYIDASMTDYKTTLVYSASSQGSVLKLDPPTGSDPEFNIIATLTDSLGNPAPGKTVTFDTSDGIFTSPNPNNTVGDGTASIVLNVSNANGTKITNIQVKNTSTNAANITWNTINNITVTAKSGYVFNSKDVAIDVSTTGCVFYGTSPGIYPYISEPCDAGSSHSAFLTGLLPYTAYYFIVNSSRPDGSIINSTEYMFVTNAETIATPPASVTNLFNISYAPLYINWTWTDPTDSDFKQVKVYIDGDFKENVPKGQQYYNASYFSPYSSHTINTCTEDTAGNVNTSCVPHSANTDTNFITYVFDFLNITGTVTDPNSAKDDSDSGASTILTEGINNNINVIYNWSFTPPIVNNESWAFSYTTPNPASLTVSAGNITTDGIPPGSLFANISVTSNLARTATTSWRSPNFTWSNGTPTSATLNFSFKVAQFTGSSGTNNYEVFLIDPNGIKKQINQTTTFSGTIAWGNFSNNSISVADFSTQGNYSILLNATLTTTRVNPSTPGIIEVRWDNPNLTLKYNTYSLNVTANTTNIPESSKQELQIRYYVSTPGDNFTLQVYNSSTSAWDNKTTLNQTAMSYFNYTLQPGEWISDGTMAGTSNPLNKYYVLVRYLDKNPNSTEQGRLNLDYQRVNSS